MTDVPEFVQATGQNDYAHNTTVYFEGAAAKYVKITANSNWGGIGQCGLSEVRFFYKPVRAREPRPAPGQANVPLDVVLGWRAGREAATHEVYFDTSEQAVRDGTVTPESVPGNGCMASYAPSSLELGQTYYWKVTEVNDAQSPASWDSDVWSFSTVEYSVVDDFEDYNDTEPDRIFDAWIDGWGIAENGSQVGYSVAPFAEQTIVNSGTQSMPFSYNNTGAAAYSEAIHSFDAPQDWSRAGVKTLTLYFYGDLDNNANESLWVKLTDQSGSATVRYGTYADEDVNNLTELSWHEWNIALAGLGIDLAHVESISIGFGDPGGMSSGNSGWMYFDDIRLYPTRCVASKGQPCGDLNDDCVVDYLDLEILGEDWLLTYAVIATSPVSVDGLVAHWALDGDADDNSGNNNHGTLMGSPRWIAAGQIGGALALDGVEDYVNCSVSTSLNITDAITLSAWVKTNDTGNGQHNPYITKGDTSYGLKHFTDNGIEFFIYDGDWYQARSDALDSSFNGVWHHVAGTYDGSELKLYLDGALLATTEHVGSIATNQFAVNIGRNSEADDGTRFYEGLIDDVRIYNRALSSAEIAYLADTTQGDGQLYVPVPSAAELYSSEPAGSRSIDFKDYAELVSAWLEQSVWP